MNVSMTDHLASSVRKKVKSGRYNNASEVVRDAVRRMMVISSNMQVARGCGGSRTQ